MRLVSDIIKEIEGEVKPTLKNTSEHKGFCVALAAVNTAIGGVHMPTPDEYMKPVCPDCGVVMSKRQGKNKAGEDAVVWTCGCQPTATTDDQDGGD